MLTPRAQRWHHLRASDPVLNDLPNVRAWFDRAEEVLFGARYAPHANYASQQHEVYMSLGAFGTGVLFVGQDETRNGLLYRAVHLADCAIAENFQGRVDTLFRDFDYTARQATQRWGDANPEAIRRAAEKEPERKFRFIHAVQPRADRDRRRADAANKPIASVYVAEEGRKIVQQSGFDEFPYMVSRYVTAPREVYGRSPAMTVLPDIKMLNEMNKTTIRQAQLAVEPPILVYDDGVLGRPDGFGLTPGFINYGGVNRDGRPLMQPFQSAARVDIGLDMMEQRRRTINDAFLVTLFQILVDQPSMTATEAMIRAQEKGALLTPVMGRQQSEALGPMIERELAVLQRVGLLPPMPDALVEAEGEFEIEYDSPLSRAQRSEQIVGITRTFDVLAPLAAAQPDIFDVFDGDALAQLAASGQRRPAEGPAHAGPDRGASANPHRRARSAGPARRRSGRQSGRGRNRKDGEVECAFSTGIATGGCRRPTAGCSARRRPIPCWPTWRISAARARRRSSRATPWRPAC